MIRPVISIVTISFNQARFLAAAIESIIGQGYDNLDYIVVDPGSTDGSRTIIERYRDRIATVILDPDAGPADGLNAGFAAARGEIFGYINADDLLLPGALDTVARAFAARPGTGIVCGNGVMIDEHGRSVRTMQTSRFSLTAMGHGAMTFVQQGKFFRRSAFERAGGFNTANRSCWDGELLVDMALAGAAVANIPDRLGAFRLYEGTISGSAGLAERMRPDMDRIRAKALGRPPAARDRLLAPAYLLARRLANPAATLAGVAARLRRPAAGS